MTALLAYPIALAVAVPTTLVVLALWVAHARLVDGDRADSVFLSFVFLFVPHMFFASAGGNLLAVALGQLVGLVSPSVAFAVTIAAAGVFVWIGCAWMQGGVRRLRGGPAPLTLVPVAMFSLADMAILAGGLSLLPAPTNL